MPVKWAQALAAYQDADLIWGPMGGPSYLPTTVAAQRADAQGKLDAVIKTYGLTGDEDAFREVMTQSAEKFHEYQLFPDRRLGDKEELRSLARALRLSSGLLKKRQLRNRLEAAIKAADDDELPPSQGIEFEFGPRVFVSPSRAGAHIDGLRVVVDLAIALPATSNRSGDGLRRDDILAAAEPLYDFWTKTLKRRGMSRSGEQLNQGGRFLHTCLNLISGPVSERLIARLFARLKAR